MALIPPFFIDTVIAIGKEINQGGLNKKHWIGTGFLFGTFQGMMHLAKWLVRIKKA